jgi:MFS family permease
MVLPFLTLYLTVDRHFSAGMAGLAITVYGIAAIMIAPVAGKLSDRFGGLLVIKLSLILSGAILFVFPLVNSLAGIFVICGLWAITNEAFRPPSMSIIGDLTAPSQRKAAFALSRLAINLGMSIGPVAGGLLTRYSFRSLFYVDGGTSILAGLLVALLPWRFQQKSPSLQTSAGTADSHSTSVAVTKPAPAPKYTNVLKDRRFVYFLIAMLPIELVFFQSLAAMPLFLVRDLHFTEAGFGSLLAINTVIIILVEVPLNSVMSDWSHRHSLALGAWLVGAGFGALVFVEGTFGAAATIVLWTVGEMILLPASAAFVSDIAPREQSGAYMGLYTMGFSVALAIGPWLGIQTLDRFGSASVWIGTFGCGCITAAMVWLLPVKERILMENR